MLDLIFERFGLIARGGGVEDVGHIGCRVGQSLRRRGSLIVNYVEARQGRLDGVLSLGDRRHRVQVQRAGRDSSGPPRASKHDKCQLCFSLHAFYYRTRDQPLFVIASLVPVLVPLCYLLL